MCLRSKDPLSANDRGGSGRTQKAKPGILTDGRVLLFCMIYFETADCRNLHNGLTSLNLDKSRFFCCAIVFKISLLLLRLASFARVESAARFPQANGSDLLKLGRGVQTAGTTPEVFQAFSLAPASVPAVLTRPCGCAGQAEFCPTQLRRSRAGRRR